MKRYKQAYDYYNPDTGDVEICAMVESENGEWVKQNDVEKLEYENRSYKELIKSFYIVTNNMLIENAKLEEVFKVVSNGVCKNTECAEIIKQLKTKEEGE